MSPTYSYECALCDTAAEEIRCIADRDNAPVCPICEQCMERVQTPVTGVVKNPAVPKRIK